MFNSNILDVMIGVVFMFLLLSMATSWFTEFWAQLFKLRSKHLKNYLREWIDDGQMSGYVDELYNGHVIGALYRKQNKGLLKDRQGPSFISAGDFVTAVFETSINLEEGQVQHSFTDYKRYVRDNPNIPDKLKKPLLAIMSEAAAKAGSRADRLALARTEIEKWYDSIMDRAEGYYKRTVWWYGLFSALLLAMLSNIDTIAISRSLWENQDLSLSVAAAANDFARTSQEIGFTLEEGSGGSPGELAYGALQEVGATLNRMESTGLPLFWKFSNPEDMGEDRYNQEFSAVFGSGEKIAAKIGGVLLTATAASFGAQIWFDILKQLVNVRGTGPKPDSSKKESKEESLQINMGMVSPLVERVEALGYIAAPEEPEPVTPPPAPPTLPAPDED